jgi:hypothetical protein
MEYRERRLAINQGGYVLDIKLIIRRLVVDIWLKVSSDFK